MAGPDTTSLEQRLTELEMRVGFQEHALTELSDALASARMEVSRNAERLRRALDDLRQSRGSGDYADPASEPPPPHY